ncbi:alpha/beta fold hydrolase [Anaerovibrio sp.]|uniref:alpha/beta fold hydrolase n=1 Tax=Anaerovibrio sp. TaxID=1872532 RepID=UPI00388F14FC
MIYNAKELTLNVQDLQFDYITFGHGTKPLVMIQGLNTNGIKGAALSLAYMYRIFAKDYKVYLFDRRPAVQEGITVRDMASDIAMAMDILGIKNADLFGVSQGGMIAQYLAIDRPDLVRKLVLAVTLSQNNDTVKKIVHNWIELAELGAMKELVADMAKKMYSDTYIKRYRPFMSLLTILQKPKDVGRFVILAKACLTCNTYEVLDQIKCPVFVLGGRQDKVVTGVASEEIASKLGCKIHMYDSLGHAAYEEAKDFNQIVYDFLIG